MTSNSYFSRVAQIVLAVFVVLVAGYATIPSFVFAAEAPSFTALTSIPGVQEAANSQSLAILLNNLYRLCIGAAAVIAVLKIVQGGVIYMLGDSITEKKDAKHHITMAVLGLLFLLTPYLVFSVIDPRILRLDVDVSGLTPGPVTPQPTAEDYTDDGEFLGDGVGDPGGGVGQEGDGPAGLNWVYRFAAGQYFYVVGEEIRSPEEGVNCYALDAAAAATAQACQTALTTYLTDVGAENPVRIHDCVLSNGNDVNVHVNTNLPICEY